MNRIVDSTVFGSGNSDKTLCVDKEELRGSDWFSHRRLSYHRDDQNGILFLHFSSDFGGGFEFGSAIEEEEHQFGNLQGMLFMFSVSFLYIYLSLSLFRGITANICKVEDLIAIRRILE